MNEAPLYPVFLKLAQRPCVLIGAGRVGSRKLEGLLTAGASVTIVAPHLSEAAQIAVAERRVTWIERAYEEGDLAGACLVIAATPDRAVNEAVAAEATRRGIPANVVDDRETSSCFLPAVLRRGAVTAAFSTEGVAPVLAVQLRLFLARTLTPGIEIVAEAARELRPRVRELLTPAGRRDFWRAAFGEALRWPRAESKAHWLARWERALRGMQEPTGEVYLVGAGPGDPELLTLQALRYIERADVVLYDRLIGEDILAYCRADAEKIYVGKCRGACALDQTEIEHRMIAEARAGKRVLRLKGGDPFLFGRGGEEQEAVRAAGIRCFVAPGITSALGCAAYAGIPLTHRNHAHAVLFVTAHGEPEVKRIDWGSAADRGITVAVYMGLAQLASVSAHLIAAGRAATTPVALIERGTRVGSRVIRTNLQDMADAARLQEARSPVMTLIGDVVTLADDGDLPRLTEADHSTTLRPAIALASTGPGQ